MSRRCEMCNDNQLLGEILCKSCQQKIDGWRPDAEYREPDITDVLRILAELRAVQPT